MGMAFYFMTEDTSGRRESEIYRHRRERQEAREREYQEEQKRLKTRPAKHDKLRGTYGQRK